MLTVKFLTSSTSRRGRGGWRGKEKEREGKKKKGREGGKEGEKRKEGRNFTFRN